MNYLLIFRVELYCEELFVDGPLKTCGFILFDFVVMELMKIIVGLDLEREIKYLIKMVFGYVSCQMIYMSLSWLNYSCGYLFLFRC